MYEDDELFAQALRCLERTFAQRRALVNALANVTLLHRAEVAVFGGAARLQSRLSYLGSLVRSSEVWGVCSKVSGPFQRESYETVLKTGKLLADFLLEPALKVDLKQFNKSRVKASSVNISEAVAAAEKVLSKRRQAPKKVFRVLPEENMSFYVAGRMSPPTKEHQEVLRAMDLGTILSEALVMDYNLAFMGSICTDAERVESRRMILEAQKALVDLAVLFVTGNPKNQEIVMAHLPALCKLMGPFRMPPLKPDFDPALKAELEASVAEPRTGMGTEFVLIECLRGNVRLCADAVPKEILEQIGSFLELDEDPSTSQISDFFLLLCEPEGPESVLPINQECVF